MRMKRSKVKMCALIIVVSLVFTGCGETPTVLTESEEAIIVNYAAHIVSKYNQKQPDGITYVSDSIYEEAADTEESSETVKSDSQSGNGDVLADSDTQAEETNQVTLTQALGLDGITAEYVSSELIASYIQSDYYAIDASAGNVYLVLHIDLTNTTSEDKVCDLLSAKPIFHVEVNGNVTASAQTTILLNDLGTYQGTIVAGEKVETVLLFEIPKTQVETVNNVKLTVKIGDVINELSW